MICCSQKYNNVSKIAAWCSIDEMLQLADQWGQQVVPQLLDHKCAALIWTEGWNLDAIWLYVAELWLQWVNCLVLVEPLVCGQCNPPMGFPWSFITFPLTQRSASSLSAISLSDFSADAWPLSCTFPSCCCVLPYDGSHIAFLGILGSCSICFMATLFGFFVATVSGGLGGCSGLNKHWILSCLHLRQRVSL